MPASTSARSQLTNVAESALVQSYLQGLAPAMLGGIDDKPAEIKANGGKPPVIFNYADYGVYQPGYAIVASKEMVKDNPDLVRRFVKATLEAVKEAKANPDESIKSLINWSAASRTRRQQAREVLDVTLSILNSPNNKDKPPRPQRRQPTGTARSSAEEVQGPEDRPAGVGLLHQRVHAGEAGEARGWRAGDDRRGRDPRGRARSTAAARGPCTRSGPSTSRSSPATSSRCSGPRAAARAPCC